MTAFNPILLRHLEKKGVTASQAFRLIRDVAVMISAGRPADLEMINRKLKSMGRRLTLDHRTLELIIESFRDAGHAQLDPGESLDDPAGQQQLIDKIYQERGIDFRGYSRTSLSRRFTRRLRECNMDGYAEYLAKLDEEPKEYERLINSIFVTVTRFFRNKDAFEALTRILGESLARAPDRSLKIWSVGCATGQEPYTIAMLAARHLSTYGQGDIRIVATDIDDVALETAHGARFSKEEVQNVPENWLTGYFEKKENDYTINPTVRSLVTFVHHNLVSDPAYHEVDIIVCRNVLIYFNLALQTRVIEKFYNSLRSQGHLLLGRYEMLIKQAGRQFACVDFDARLYRKK